MFSLSILVKYPTAYEITFTIDKARTLTARVCVCVCKSMTVNGRNPSTNPHLSSWITDIINRRYSSISPVFPIQRWEGGLFPSLSADLMTFSKLPYACVYLCVCVYIQYILYTQSKMCLCVFLCLMFVLGKLVAVCSVCFINIVDQFEVSGQFGFPLWALSFFFFFFAVVFDSIPTPP